MNPFFEASQAYHSQIRQTYSQLQERMANKQIEEVQLVGCLYVKNGKLIVRAEGNTLPISGECTDWFLLLLFIYENYGIEEDQEGEDAETIRYIPEAVPILINRLNELAT